MNDKIKQHLINYCEKHKYDTDDGDLWEVLTECSKKVYEEKIDSRRWWDDYFTVVELDGMLIGFDTAKTTGDDSPWDKGWEWDLGTVCEVLRTEKIVTVIEYAPKSKVSKSIEQMWQQILLRIGNKEL